MNPEVDEIIQKFETSLGLPPLMSLMCSVFVPVYKPWLTNQMYGSSHVHTRALSHVSLTLITLSPLPPPRPSFARALSH